MRIIIPAIALSLAGSVLASAKTFDGFHIGVSAAYNHDKVGPAFNDVPLSDHLKRDSAMIGIFAGYNKAISSHVVLGAEATLNGPADNKLHTDHGTLRITIDARLAVDLSARAGYLINDKVLVYVRGGCSSVRVRTTLNTASSSTNLDGWHAGAGLEYALGGHFQARVEYRYTDVGGSRAGYQRQQALIGMSYRL